MVTVISEKRFLHGFWHVFHSQSILAHGFPPVLVAAGFLLEEEALWEPKGTVFSLSTSNQHADHQDDQKEKRRYPHQHQLAPLRYGVNILNMFTTSFYEGVRKAEHFYRRQGSQVVCSAVSCGKTVLKALGAQTVVYFQVHYGADDFLMRLQLPLEPCIFAGVRADHGFSILVQSEAECRVEDCA